MTKPVVTVFPCACPEGHVLLGVPAVEQEVTKTEADALVATLAFTYDKSGQHPEPQPDGPPDGEPDAKET